jgi:hypothetical protein
MEVAVMGIAPVVILWYLVLGEVCCFLSAVVYIFTRFLLLLILCYLLADGGAAWLFPIFYNVAA